MFVENAISFLCLSECSLQRIDKIILIFGLLVAVDEHHGAFLLVFDLGLEELELLWCQSALHLKEDGHVRVCWLWWTLLWLFLLLWRFLV